MKSIFALLVLLNSLAFGQEVPPPVQQQLEETVAENEEVEDDAVLLQWEIYRKHPLNINTVTVEDIVFPGIVMQWQIENLIRYRKVFGDLLDIYELQAVPGFDLATIKKILPCIKVASSKGLAASLSQKLKKGSQLFMLRYSRTIEPVLGLDKSKPYAFQGDASHLLIRYRFQEKGLQFGLLAEKDPGEQLFKGVQKMGFDFYSFHVYLKNIGKIKTVALGDYVVNLGQGLVQWQSMGGGPGLQVLNIKREAPVILPYRSAGEYNFMRGAAFEFRFGNLDLAIFGSLKKLSANTEDSLDSFRAFNSSGLHRTIAEISSKNSIGEVSFGANLQIKNSRGKIGFNAIGYNLSKQIQKNEQAYNLFSLKGKDFRFLGIDHSTTIKNFHFFGEAAINKHLKWALTQGVIFSVDPRIDLSILYRKLSVGYAALHANAFMENSSVTNEEGLYTGIHLRPFRGFSVSAYTNIFYHPWLKYRIDAPSRGIDQLVSCEYQPSKSSSINIIYRSSTKAINQGSSNFSFAGPVHKQSLRFHCSNQLSPSISLRVRFEVVLFKKLNNKVEHGNLFYIESIYKKNRIHFAGRIQLFETENFDTRIYSYEPGVIYQSSIAAVHGRGFRFIINSNYDVSKILNISFKYSLLANPGKTLVGSSYTAVEGSNKSDFTLQVSLVF